MTLDVHSNQLDQLRAQVQELEEQLREQQAIHNQLVAYAEDLNRTYLELRLRLQQLTSLSALSTRLGRARNVDSCARVCVDGVPDILTETRGRLYLEDRRGASRLLADGFGDVPEPAERSFDLLARQASQEEQPLTYHWTANERPYALIALPLVARGKAFGTLLACRVGPALTEYERHVVELLGNSVAVAISNARLYQETRRLAITDATTGLYNSRYFRTALAQEMQKARRLNYPMALIMCDIDHFKVFNDTYGHPKGNIALLNVARAIVRCLRQTDTVARYGGEEFAVILPGCEESALAEVAEKIRLSVKETPIRVGARREPVHVTISVGAAWQNAVDADPGSLQSMADEALYGAKARGRDRSQIGI